MPYGARSHARINSGDGSDVFVRESEAEREMSKRAACVVSFLNRSLHSFVFGTFKY
jgi:hypothetical protein